MAAIVFQAAVLWFCWNQLPEQVPMHFGFGGAPDSYGPKSTLFLTPGIAVALYLLMTVASFFPQFFNYPVTVTDQNRERLQAIATATVGWLKAEVMWLFAVIGWMEIRVSTGASSGLGWAFLPVTLCVIGATITVSIVRIRRAA